MTLFVPDRRANSCSRNPASLELRPEKYQNVSSAARLLSLSTISFSASSHPIGRYASAPRSRLYGRQLSRAMVWTATLSLDITDPLCGFRGIPLRATVELLDAVTTGDHMEFDPQLVIRLHWRGVPVRNVPTRVVYDPHGVSHFDMLNAVGERPFAEAMIDCPQNCGVSPVNVIECQTGHKNPKPKI